MMLGRRVKLATAISFVVMLLVNYGANAFRLNGMDDRDDAILRSAKFKVPVPREGYVVREELFARLDMALQTSVTYVRGGAGTGKTMVPPTLLNDLLSL